MSLKQLYKIEQRDFDGIFKDQLRKIKPLLPNSTIRKGPIKQNPFPPVWYIKDLRVFTTTQEVINEDKEVETWYHVSYTYGNKIPNHYDTLSVREHFFRPDVLVVAIFPPINEYINQHPNVLHLWQKIGKRLIPDLRILADVTDPSSLTI